jgi:MFS family permease
MLWPVMVTRPQRPPAPPVGARAPGVVNATALLCGVLGTISGLATLGSTPPVLLWLVGWVIQRDDGFRSSSAWSDYVVAGVWCALVVGTALLVLAARRLPSRDLRTHRGWVDGLVAAGGIAAGGVAAGLAPLISRGQGWQPEVWVGLVLLTVAGALTALLLHPSTRDWSRPA